MSVVVGVDPGVRWTGLAAVERGRVVHAARLRGADGTSRDWALLARTARRLALEVSGYVAERGADLVAVETMVDQAAERRLWANRHTTAACCQAVWDVAAAQGWSELVVWQHAADVLDPRTGFGQVRALLVAGRAPAALSAVTGRMDEHRASAACHALAAEAARRAAVGRRG
jgi:Holliday junction resolvasome RuvABC endonuclease subunit